MRLDTDLQDTHGAMLTGQKCRTVKHAMLLSWACLSLAALLLGIGYAPLGIPWLAAIALLAVLGMAGWRWARPGGLALAGFTALAAAGFWLGAGPEPAAGIWPGWLLGGMALALAGWDLAAFGRRLRAAPRLLDEDILLLRHLLRLGGALLGGLALAAAGLVFQARLSLGWGLLLGLLAAGGLGWGMRFYRRG